MKNPTGFFSNSICLLMALIILGLSKASLALPQLPFEVSFTSNTEPVHWNYRSTKWHKFEIAEPVGPSEVVYLSLARNGSDQRPFNDVKMKFVKKFEDNAISISSNLDSLEVAIYRKYAEDIFILTQSRDFRSLMASGGKYTSTIHSNDQSNEVPGRQDELNLSAAPELLNVQGLLRQLSELVYRWQTAGHVATLDADGVSVNYPLQPHPRMRSAFSSDANTKVRIDRSITAISQRLFDIVAQHGPKIVTSTEWSQAYNQMHFLSEIVDLRKRMVLSPNTTRLIDSESAVHSFLVNLDRLIELEKFLKGITSPILYDIYFNFILESYLENPDWQEDILTDSFLYKLLTILRERPYNMGRDTVSFVYLIATNHELPLICRLLAWSILEEFAGRTNFGGNGLYQNIETALDEFEASMNAPYENPTPMDFFVNLYGGDSVDESDSVAKNAQLQIATKRAKQFLENVRNISKIDGTARIRAALFFDENHLIQPGLPQPLTQAYLRKRYLELQGQRNQIQRGQVINYNSNELAARRMRLRFQNFHRDSCNEMFDGNNSSDPVNE